MSGTPTMIAVHAVPGAWLPRTETWLFNQVRHLPPAVESHVLCERTENLDQFPVTNLHALSDASRPRRWWDRGLCRLRLRPHFGYLARRARALAPAIVHSHFGPTGWSQRHVARRAGARHVVTFYGLDVNHLPATYPVWRKRYRRLFDDVDGVLCEGPHMAACVRDMGCPAEKMRVHHLGVDIDRIPFEPLAWTPPAPLRVLIAAAFREKKGIPDALEAVGRLRDELPIEVTLIGDAADDPRGRAEKAAIHDVIARYGLEDRVRRLGFQPHDTLLREAARHHVFLAPSRTAADGDTEGGAPVAIIEMMAAGMVVLSTRHCDIPGIVRDGETGVLADERDVDGLVAGLRRIAGAPDTWDDLRENGRRHVEREFEAGAQGERLAAIYEEIVRGS